MVFQPKLLNSQECALLLLHLISLRSRDGAEVSRVRLSELTLKRLWGRERLGREFLEETQEWLSRGGWTLLYARTTYAAVKTSAVLGWSRLSSKRMLDDLKKINEGVYDFTQHYHLLHDGESDEE